MIISASRRTDIPAFHSEWFMERVRDGGCRVANPFNPSQVTRISLKPEDVDAICFWTRNPAPLIPRLRELDERGFRYYFLYTITGYPTELEPHVPPRDEAVRTFRELAGMIGPECVIWRYDPILITSVTPFDYHTRSFNDLASALAGATRQVKVSLVCEYRAAKRRLAALGAGGIDYTPHPETRLEFEPMIGSMVESARANGIEMVSCAEAVDLRPHGIEPGKCIDDELISCVFGVEVPRGKDPGQRKACRCVASKDIGVYDTCRHGCVYCYATSK